MSNKKLTEISAFFPAYNDEGTIKLMVERLHKVLSKISNNYEIIIIDDCSPDNSGKIADDISKKDKKVKVIHHIKNRGYGGALKSGFKNSKYKWIFYTDGDAQYNVADLEKFLPHALSEKYDVINGYKIRRGDGIFRNYLGKIYNLGVHIMFNLKQVKEVNCDFRLMRKDIFDNIKLESEEGTICLEMMKKIESNGYKIKNLPVNHYRRMYGNSNFAQFSKIFRTLVKLFNLWIKYLTKGFIYHKK